MMLHAAQALNAQSREPNGWSAQKWAMGDGETSSLDLSNTIPHPLNAHLPTDPLIDRVP
jgi:hypothetical protein